MCAFLSSLRSCCTGSTLDQEEVDLFGLHGRFESLTSNPIFNQDSVENHSDELKR